MKAVILAGGRGTRMGAETELRPKPMVEIGGRPLLWHVMKLYAAAGIEDFLVCLGYRGSLVKEWFATYRLQTADVVFDLGRGTMEALQPASESWRVTLVDTGQETMTGGRLRRIASHVAGEEAFCMTYGDGVSDVDIAATVAFHRAHGRLATLTAVRPPGRYGALGLAGDAVRSFVEKPDDGGWINGGFFVLDPGALDYVDGDATVWEEEPLRRLAADGQLAAYRHAGFWRAMDTARDRNALEALWAGGAAPWKLW